MTDLEIISEKIVESETAEIEDEEILELDDEEIPGP